LFLLLFRADNEANVDKEDTVSVLICRFPYDLFFTFIWESELAGVHSVVFLKCDDPTTYNLTSPRGFPNAFGLKNEDRLGEACCFCKKDWIDLDGSAELSSMYVNVLIPCDALGFIYSIQSSTSDKVGIIEDSMFVYLILIFFITFVWINNRFRGNPLIKSKYITVLAILSKLTRSKVSFLTFISFN